MQEDCLCNYDKYEFVRMHWVNVPPSLQGLNSYEPKVIWWYSRPIPKW